MAATLLAFACSSDEEKPVSPATDAGVDASPGSDSGAGGKSGAGGAAANGGSGGAATDAGGNGVPDSIALCAGKTGAAQITCGKYIVEHVTVCGDCHSPRLPNGQLDPAKILAGNPSLVDIDPATAGKGNIPAPNLTQLKGFGWTPAMLMDAFLNGKRPAARGGNIFPIMPYFTMHNMAKPDAEAIAAYILQLTPITNAIAGREPLPAPLDVISFLAAPVPLSEIPDPVIAASDANYSEAMRGKYLAAQLGPCMECHTPQKPITMAIDMSKPFGGGRAFPLGPPIGTVTAANITPDVTGIRDWLGTGGSGAGAANVQKALQQGTDPMGDHICPPMPVGPMGAFGGLTDADAFAIGLYITHLPPISNGTDGGPFKMVTCNPPGDGGMMMPDASMPMDAAGGG